MCKILVVEDMPDSAELAAQILRRYGHEVFIASTGHGGLELASEQRPDLIIFDYWLPDLSALSFLSGLRSDENLMKIPVLACTATPLAALRPGLGPDGFNGFIHKPYRMSSFMETVEAYLPADSETSRQ